MTNAKHLLLYSTALLILVSCGNNPEPAEAPSDFIEITSQQFATESMQLGEIETKAFESLVKCNGSIVPLPDGLAKVNAFLPGVIKEIYCNNGQFVAKNQPLIEIAGNEVIDIQKDFAESSANYKRLKSEYERIKSLYEEKVTSEKEFIIAESAYNVAKAQYNGLKSKLEAIGLSSSQIEGGNFYSSYSVKAPIGGYISSLTTNIGSYADPQAELCEITDPDKFQLRLAVFADEISNVKKGQMVRFRPVNSTGEYLAMISSTGISVNNDSKSIDCYAAITDESYTTPIANTFVGSEIITRTDTVYALPSDAVAKTETGHFILVLEKQERENYFFKKVNITTGRMNNGYTEIMGNPVNGSILVRGGYNVVAE